MEEKVLRAAGGVAHHQVADLPQAPEISVIPERNSEARRADQVYLVEYLLSDAELRSLVERFS